MVIVEFFDKVSLENICGALLCRPERVVFVGPNRKRMERGIALYQRLLISKGISTELSCISAPRNNLHSIVDRLSEIVEQYGGDCVFDLTGGDDLYLVAVGIIMERYKEKVKCHRFNFLNDQLCDCDADGEILEVAGFDISIEDNITIYGGNIITDPNSECYTYKWDFSGDFLSDIEAMWSICRQNPRLWNTQMNCFGAICNAFEMDSPLEISFDQKEAELSLYGSNNKYVCIIWMLRELQKKGLINSLYVDDTVYFKFKNEQVKRCLTVAGQILELFVAARLRAIKDESGLPLYNDVKVGTVISWNPSEDGFECSTINEVDVIAMRGAVPVFISCKNGYFDANELYKLNTVAQRFGNKYAKKVLIATEMDKLGDKAEYLNSRMDDMDITCIDNVDVMSDSELERILTSLWKN